MIIKRTFWFVLLLLSFIFVACGGSEAETAVSEPADTPTTAADVASLPEQISVQTVNEVKDRDDVFVIDVREQWEYDEGHIPGITLIPMGDIPTSLDELPRDKEILLTCRSGNRSGQMLNLLKQEGFTNVHNMQGGILAWEAAGFEVEK